MSDPVVEVLEETYIVEIADPAGGESYAIQVTDEVVRVIDIGVQGPPGSAPPTYVHTQSVPSDTWTIEHGLGTYPSVSVVDSAGNTIISDVRYDTTSRLVVTFSASFSGKAYLN